MSTTEETTSIVYNIPEINFGTTTSWIPVTSAWPSISGCASSFFLFPGQPGPAAWDPGYGYFFSGTPRCLPPAATTWWEQDHQNGDGFTTISIRPIVCPAAFTTAATYLQSGSSTLVLCCPSEYNLYSGEGVLRPCTSSLTPGQIITYLASFSTGVSNTTLAVQSSTWINAVPFNGWNIATPTTSGVLSSSSSSTLGSTNTPSITNTSSVTSASQSCSGLSPGAKGGIGASAAIGAIGIISLIWAAFLLRRRPRTAPYSTQQQQQQQQIEVDSRQVHEMGAERKPAELSSVRPSVR